MSTHYEVVVDARVTKELRRVSPPDKQRILATIANLANDPFPPGAKKLSGRPGWRVRVGDYRILYDVDHGILRVFVFRAVHRRSIYD